MSLPVDRRLQRQPLVPIGNDAVKVDGPYGWTQRVCLNAAGALRQKDGHLCLPFPGGLYG